jgi:preprotein translocase subunit SecD
MQIYKTQDEADKVAANADSEVLEYSSDGSNTVYAVARKSPIVTGDDLRDAQSVKSANGASYSISFSLKKDAADKIRRVDRKKHR